MMQESRLYTIGLLHTVVRLTEHIALLTEAICQTFQFAHMDGERLLHLLEMVLQRTHLVLLTRIGNDVIIITF